MIRTSTNCSAAAPHAPRAHGHAAAAIAARTSRRVTATGAPLRVGIQTKRQPRRLRGDNSNAWNDNRRPSTRRPSAVRTRQLAESDRRHLKANCRRGAVAAHHRPSAGPHSTRGADQGQLHSSRVFPPGPARRELNHRFPDRLQLDRRRATGGAWVTPPEGGSGWPLRITLRGARSAAWIIAKIIT